MSPSAGYGALGATATRGSPPTCRWARKVKRTTLQAGVAVRTFSNVSPTVLYPAADELADFGALQATLSLRVAQKSAVVGRGFEAGVVVSIT